MKKDRLTLLALGIVSMGAIGIAGCGSSSPLKSEHQALHHQEVTLNLSGGGVVVVPNVIGVQSGDIVEFESRDGQPDVTFDPPSAVRLVEQAAYSERITVLQSPFEFYCALIVNGVRIAGTYGGCGKTEPPTVTGIDPSALAHGSPDTAITISGTNFIGAMGSCLGTTGLVNGNARSTQYVGNTSVVVTVTAADLAQTGTLNIAARNVTTSNSVTLTVQ